MKTLVLILNHNLKEETDKLFESLYPYCKEDYEIGVLDNGSNKDQISKYTVERLETNQFFGGGLNKAFQIVLDNSQYDSLLFLNNDLVMFPYNFVSKLRHEMFPKLNGNLPKEEFQIVSGIFYNVEPYDQCHWPTMHNWCSSTIRTVPFIDFQMPLFNRKFIEIVNQYPAENKIGWGLDFLSAIICRRNNFKLGVIDYVSALHLNSLTVKRGVAGLDVSTYCQLAEKQQYEMFKNLDLLKEWNDLKIKSQNYSKN